MSRKRRRGAQAPAPEGASEPESEHPGGNAPPGKPVPHVWDHPEDDDPPSQRPEDTYEEARRRRVG